MPEMGEKPSWDPARTNLRFATDEQLAQLKGMTDDELLKCSQTLDLFAVAESMRRLRKALQKEEAAIKWLTGVLVVLTLVLIYLGFKAVPLK